MPQELQGEQHSSDKDRGATQMGPRMEVQAHRGRLGGHCRGKAGKAKMEAGMVCGDIRVRGGEQWVCHLCEMGTNSNGMGAVHASTTKEDDKARGRGLDNKAGGRGLDMGNAGGAVEEDGEESDGAGRGVGLKERKKGWIGWRQSGEGRKKRKKKTHSHKNNEVSFMECAKWKQSWKQETWKQKRKQGTEKRECIGEMNGGVVNFVYFILFYFDYVDIQP